MESETTKWKKQIIETLTPTITTTKSASASSSSQDFATGEYDSALIDVPKSADESILMGSDAGPAKQEDPPPPKTVDSAKLPTKMTPALAAKIYNDKITSVPDLIDKSVNTTAYATTKILYKSPNDEEALKTKDIIKRQLYRFIAILFSFIIIWNWWFLWNYTNFVVNLEKPLDYPPFSILYYIFEPSFKVIELINYYMLSIRMDAGMPGIFREFMRDLWNYRPITFGIFTTLMLAGCTNAPFGSIFVSLFSGKPSGIAKLVMILSVIMYIFLTVNPERIRTFMFYFFWFPPIIVFVVLLLMLLVYVFSGFTALIFALYLFFLSNFGLLIFNGGNPFKAVSAIFKIYSDLKTAPVDDTKTEDDFKKMGQNIFRNAHILMMLSTLIAIFSIHMRDLKGMKNIGAIMFIVFVVNLWFFVAIAPFAIPAVSFVIGFVKSVIKAMSGKKIAELPPKTALVELPEAFPGNTA
jgi:hypothetical protein